MALIVFDLDGPLLDVSYRYYQVYKDILLDMKAEPLPLEQYWQMKRQKIPDTKILELSGIADKTQQFTASRLALIETPKYLELDSLWPGMNDLLQSLSVTHHLLLATLRSNRETLDQELTRLELPRHFKQILSGPAEGAERHAVKVELVKKHIQTDSVEGWFIGDTETDVHSGKALNFKTIAVTFGIRTKELLDMCAPDKICDDLNQFKHYLKTNFLS